MSADKQVSKQVPCCRKPLCRWVYYQVWLRDEMTHTHACTNILRYLPWLDFPLRPWSVRRLLPSRFPLHCICFALLWSSLLLNTPAASSTVSSSISLCYLLLVLRYGIGLFLVPDCRRLPSLCLFLSPLLLLDPSAGGDAHRSSRQHLTLLPCS